MSTPCLYQYILINRSRMLFVGIEEGCSLLKLPNWGTNRFLYFFIIMCLLVVMELFIDLDNEQLFQHVYILVKLFLC